MSGLYLESPGLFTTVQDSGRPGHRGFGVPVGGAAVRASLALANALAGNPGAAAAFEATRIGPTFRALGPVYVALAGAPIEARVENSRQEVWKAPSLGAFPLNAGDRLVTGAIKTGCRTYLAIHGGLQTPTLLGSRSCETALQAGAEFATSAATGAVLHLRPEPDSQISQSPLQIRFVPGPEYQRVPHPQLEGRVLQLGRSSNRMGGILVAEDLREPGLHPLDPNRLSAPVTAGTLQWTGSEWLLLGVACGTMGGYPHIAQIVRVDLDRLAQWLPSTKLVFVQVDVDDARLIEQKYRVALHKRCLMLRVRSEFGIRRL